MGDPVAPRRVLVVARWYPSHDDPGRGSFVADHVRALTDAGMRVTVASFEAAMLRGEAGARAEVGALAARRWRDAVTRPDAVNVPVGAGAVGVAGVPVARLPAVLEPGDRPVDVEVEAHADPLLAFGTALAEREGIDLVHAHTAIPDGLAAARLATALDVPLVVTEHASLVREQLGDPATAARVRELVGPGRRLLAVSDHLARLMEERLGVPAGTVGVIPNVVPDGLFPAEAVGAGAEAGDARPELLWVGARKASKGTDTLLRSFALVRRERPDLRLRLIGRAPTEEEEQRLRALAVDLGVADAVLFDPPVPREGVAPAMRRATLFVHPSPFETFGMVAAEALLVGSPVAATPSGVEAIVGADGACGEIAASVEPEDLATAVLRALGRIDGFDPAVMRDRVLGRYSPRAVLAATLDAYTDAAATMPGRTGAGPEAGSAAAEGQTPRDADAPGGGAAGAGGTAAGPGGDAAVGPGQAALVGPGGPVDGAEPSPTAAPIVVCMNRTVALRAIPRLPAAALEEAIVVTGPPTRQAPDPAPAAGRWRELDPAGAYRDRMAELTTQAGTGMGGRLRALSSAGARHRERDAMAADKEGWIADAGRRALEAIRDEASGPDGTPPQVVAVEAADVAAALPLLDAGVPLAPGGLRWLADRSEARRRP